MNKTIQFAAINLLLLIISCPVIAGPTIYVNRKKEVNNSIGALNYVCVYGVSGVVDGEGFNVISVEDNKKIKRGRTYDAILNIDAVGNSKNSQNDPLDPKTAFLYDSFLNGELDEYGYEYEQGKSAKKSAKALQKVIWYLEQERGKKWKQNSLEEKLYQAALNCGWTDIGNIRVLNLYEKNKYRQDLLVRIIPGIHECNPPVPPPETTVIPAPGALLMVGIGAGLVEWLRRRRVI